MDEGRAATSPMGFEHDVGTSEYKREVYTLALVSPCTTTSGMTGRQGATGAIEMHGRLGVSTDNPPTKRMNSANGPLVPGVKAAVAKKLVLPRRLDIRAALTTSPPIPDHVLPGLPVGAVGAVVAPGSTGKTMLLLQTCVALATGSPALGGLLADGSVVARSPVPARVVLVVAEETVDEMHRRLHCVVSQLALFLRPPLSQKGRDAMLDLLSSNLHIYPLAGSMRLLVDGRDTNGEDLQKLRHMSAGARLVVIDPLRQFHTGDENDSWAMTVVVQALQSVAVSNSCAVIASHHTNKGSTYNGTGDQAGAARGSAAFTDGVRWQLNLSQLGEPLASQYGIKGALHRYIRADLAKANYIAPQLPQVFLREEGGVFSLMRPSPRRSGRI